MPPTIEGTASPGNVGRPVADITATVAARTLAIVRERDPRAEVSASAGLPCGNRATHLLRVTITEWREMRTDDPAGALILPHNRIGLTLRLLRIAPPGCVGTVRFQNRARLTLNQPAARLLDDRFRRAVLTLMAGLGPTPSGVPRSPDQFESN